MPRLWPYVFSLFFLLACGSTRTPPPPAEPAIVPMLEQLIPLDLAIQADTLENGLRYFIRPNTTPSDQAEFRLVVLTGSVHESDAEQGMAHFIEHLAFNATQTFPRPQLDAYFHSIAMPFGPDLSARTDFDATTYTIQTPTLDFADLETALQILRDWAHFIRIDSTAVATVRPAVLAEARDSLDIGLRIQNAQWPILLQGTRYAQRLPHGQPAQLDTFSAAGLERFYRRLYRPDRMALIAVGDFPEEYISGLIRQYLGAIPAARPAPDQPAYTVPKRQDTRFSVIADPTVPISSVSTYFMQTLPPQHAISAYRRFILRNLCTRLLNRRLAELIHQPEPPYQRAGAGSGMLTRTTERYRVGATVPDNHLDTGLAALLTEIKRVRQHGFTSAELEQQKVESMRSVERAYNERDQAPTSRLAAELTRHVLYAEPVPVIVYEYGLHKTFIPQITLAQVNQMARQLTRPYNRTILAVSPQKQGIRVPTPATLAQIVSQVDRTPVKTYKAPHPPQPLTPDLPPPGTIVAADSIEALGLTRWTLSNGITVLLKPTAFNLDEVLFSSFSPGGHSLVADEDYIAAFTAAALVQRSGIGHLDARALEALLAQRNLSITVQINELREGLSGGSSPQELETLLQLIYLHATAPRRTPEAFTAYRDYLSQTLTQRHEQPAAALNDTLQWILAGGHFRARPWTSEILQEMDLDRSLEIYRDRFADMGDFIFVFVGNVQPDRLQPLVEHYLATLPSTGRQETWRDVGIKPPEGIVERTIYAGEDSLSRCQLVFPGSFVWTQENSYHLHTMASALRTQLYHALQGSPDSAQSLRVGASIARFPTPGYSIAIAFDAPPEQIAPITQRVVEQIALLKDAATVNPLVKPIQAAQNRQYKRQIQENSYWLSALENAYYHRTDPLQIRSFSQFINSLNAAQIARSAQRYLNVERYIRITCHPRSHNPN